MRNLILLSGFLMYSLVVLSQQTRVQKFKIFQLPPDIVRQNPSIKNLLNNELKKAQTKTDAFIILNKRLNGYKNQLVRIREQVEQNRANILDYYISELAENKTMIIDVKGSTRSQTDETIYKKYQLQLFFSDTLTVLDTVIAEMYPNDFNYRIADYFLVIENDSLPSQKIPLSFEANNRLILQRKDFATAKGNFFACGLFNNAAPGKRIAAFSLFFPDEIQLNELKDFAALVKDDNSDDPDFNDKDIAAYIIEYAKASRWGHMQERDVLQWLKKYDQ